MPTQTRPRSKVAYLSWDFDFFVRDDPRWDWGHRDARDAETAALFKHVLWRVRYASAVEDLFEATDPTTHADFLPRDALVELLSTRLVRLPPPKRPRLSFALSDSHALAYDHFAALPAPDLFVLVDAHHDCWPYDVASPQHDCGNWLRRLRLHWWKRLQGGRSPRYVWVYPRHGDPQRWGDPPRWLTALGWSELADLREALGAAPYDLTHVHACRSPEWVPPHHDEAFFELCRGFTAFSGRTTFLEDMPLRTDDAPTREEHARQVVEERERRAQLDLARAELRGGSTSVDPTEEAVTLS